MLNIVIPMAGKGSRFENAGFKKSKPFIDVNGEPMIKKVIDNLSIQDSIYTLICRSEHKSDLLSALDSLNSKKEINIVTLDHITEGTLCTLLEAREFISNDQPMLVANSDQLVDINLSDFINDAYQRALSGSILTFIDINQDPKWSFAKLNQDQEVIMVKEKEPISEYATVGIYYFSNGNVFVTHAEEMMEANDRQNGEFYTCPIYNYYIKSNRKVGIYNIKQSEMHGLGTPEDLDLYLENNA
tara:strand:- start:68 stop:796 length:729 start_codon:yes stop_codon:yes gene_type:complete